jgi:hypothetical protein
MANQPSSYTAVIADLKRKREQIDAAIKALEALEGLGGAVGEASGAGEETPPPQDGAFLGMSIPKATVALLKAKKKPLTNNEIVEALEKGGLYLSSENKQNTVGSVLNRRSRTAGDIVSPKRGQWGLKEWYPGRNFGPRKGGNGDTGQDGDDTQSSTLENADQAENESIEDIIG